MLEFRRLATLSAIICFELAATWLVTPWLVPLIWGVPHSAAVGVFGRQSGALFLGFGVLLWRARTLEPSPARKAISCGFIAACIALAICSLFDLAAGHAWWGILSAVAVELALAAGFIVVLGKDRSN